eukprot:m.146731 g.146731  ORF g.146731 m.146731 type:complete len:1137 (+) comp9699_c0_seq8:53-3463(+)
MAANTSDGSDLRPSHASLHATPPHEWQGIAPSHARPGDVGGDSIQTASDIESPADSLDLGAWPPETDRFPAEDNDFSYGDSAGIDRPSSPTGSNDGSGLDLAGLLAGHGLLSAEGLRGLLGDQGLNEQGLARLMALLGDTKTNAHGKDDPRIPGSRLEGHVPPGMRWPPEEIFSREPGAMSLRDEVTSFAQEYELALRRIAQLCDVEFSRPGRAFITAHGPAFERGHCLRVFLEAEWPARAGVSIQDAVSELWRGGRSSVLRRCPNLKSRTVMRAILWSVRVFEQHQPLHGSAAIAAIATAVQHLRAAADSEAAYRKAIAAIRLLMDGPRILAERRAADPEASLCVADRPGLAVSIKMLTAMGAAGWHLLDTLGYTEGEIPGTFILHRCITDINAVTGFVGSLLDQPLSSSLTIIPYQAQCTGPDLAQSGVNLYDPLTEDKIYIGAVVTIRWLAWGAARRRKVSIELLQGDWTGDVVMNGDKVVPCVLKSIGVIASDIPASTGHFIWKVPRTVAPGCYFMLMLRENGGPASSASHSCPFDIPEDRCPAVPAHMFAFPREMNIPLLRRDTAPDADSYVALMRDQVDAFVTAHAVITVKLLSGEYRTNLLGNRPQRGMTGTFVATTRFPPEVGVAWDTGAAAFEYWVNWIDIEIVSVRFADGQVLSHDSSAPDLAGSLAFQSDLHTESDRAMITCQRHRRGHDVFLANWKDGCDLSHAVGDALTQHGLHAFHEVACIFTDVSNVIGKFKAFVSSSPLFVPILTEEYVDQLKSPDFNLAKDCFSLALQNNRTVFALVPEGFAGWREELSEIGDHAILTALQRAPPITLTLAGFDGIIDRVAKAARAARSAPVSRPDAKAPSNPSHSQSPPAGDRSGSTWPPRAEQVAPHPTQSPSAQAPSTSLPPAAAALAAAQSRHSAVGTPHPSPDRPIHTTVGTSHPSPGRPIDGAVDAAIGVPHASLGRSIAPDVAPVAPAPTSASLATPEPVASYSQLAEESTLVAEGPDSAFEPVRALFIESSDSQQMFLLTAPADATLATLRPRVAVILSELTETEIAPRSIRFMAATRSSIGVRGGPQPGSLQFADDRKLVPLMLSQDAEFRLDSFRAPHAEPGSPDGPVLATVFYRIVQARTASAGAVVG